MGEKIPEDWNSAIEGSQDRVTFESGRLDEVCGSKGAHLEHMHGDRWFLLIGHDDGTETAIWFNSADLLRPFYERREPRPAIRTGVEDGRGCEREPSPEEKLRRMMALAQARYDAMSPEQKAAHDKAQRESWVRGMMPTGDPRFD